MSAPLPRQRKRNTLAAAVLLGALALPLAIPAAQAAPTATTTTNTDSMSRTMENGWGNGWTYEAPARVDGAEASLTTRPGQTNTMNRAGVGGDTKASYQFTNDAHPAESIYNRVQVRKNGGTYYSAVLRSTANKPSYLQLEKVTNGKTTILGGTNLAILKPGIRHNIELQAAGTSTVELSASVWEDGKATPTTAQVKAVDKTAPITGGTQIGVSTYLGSKALTPVVTKIDNATSQQVQLRSPGYVEGWGEPTFNDDFNTLDLAKWRVRDGDYLGYDWSVMRSSNVSVAGGNLTMATNRLSAPVKFKDGKERYYSSAYMDTMGGKFSQAYGRFEVRAKLPTIKGQSKGLWPAFWLRPLDTSKGGEIDIFEGHGTPSTKSFDASWRTEATVHHDQTGKSKKNVWTPAGIDVNDGKFHTWTVEWTPIEMTFLIDGVPYFVSSPKDDPRWVENFGSGHPYTIRLNVAVGSDYWGVPNAKETADRTEYVIDYVRAWDYQGKK